MSKPNEEQLLGLGKPVLPFERTNFKRKVLDGETLKDPFLTNIYDATENDYPKDAFIVEFQDIIQGRAEDAKYLWIIDENGLFIIPEKTENTSSVRGIVCHTNLTGGMPAIQGGELWFGSNGVVYVNNKSGRYGATTLIERQAILDYFEFVGYKNVEQLTHYHDI